MNRLVLFVSSLVVLGKFFTDLNYPIVSVCSDKKTLLRTTTPTTPATKTPTMTPTMTPTTTPTTKPTTPTTLAFMVQGPAEALQIWINRFGALTTSPAYNRTFVSNIKLFYASYDRPVSFHEGAWMCKDNKDNGNGFACQTFFLPKSTWTEGRNALTRLAWCDQQRADFLYWVFFDDDIEFHCPDAPEEAEKHDLPCWDNFLRNLEVAGHYEVPYVAANDQVSENGMFLAASRFDAAVSAIYHKYVTNFLPYAYMPPGTSWWESQAIFFMVVETCFPEMGVLFPGMQYRNAEHRDYQRGLNLKEIETLTLKNYQKYVPFIKTPSDLQQQTGQGNLHNWTAVQQHLQRQQLKLQNDTKRICEDGLTERFFNFLNRTNEAINDNGKSYDMCDPFPFERTFP